MAEVRDWQHGRAIWVRLREESTGVGPEAWNRRIERVHLPDEKSLRARLATRGVSGCAQTLLVMERFGYPDFFTASAAQLIDGQYADRLQLRPILDAIVAAAAEFGEVAVQARKTNVSLVPRAGPLPGSSRRDTAQSGLRQPRAPSLAAYLTILCFHSTLSV